MFARCRMAAAFLIAAITLSVGAALAAPIAEKTQIPVIINIYKNAGISKEDAKKAVEEASKILGQAGYKLTVVQENEDVTKGDAGEDGEISPADDYKEMRDMVDKGKEELVKTPNKKGIKISFVKTPWVGSDTPGWAYHDEPVAVVKKRATTGQTGQTIAHEIGHILTLDANHKIDGSTNADGGGHAPEKPGASGKENIMAPSNYRSGTKLTQAQVDEMLKKRYVRGKCSEQWDRAYGGQKSKQQYGSSNSGLNPTSGAPAHADVMSTTLSSLDGAPGIYGSISLGGLFSGAASVNAAYSLAFDTDGNSATGYSYAGFAGMERALELGVTGSAGSYTVDGWVRDLATGTLTALPVSPYFEDAQILTDLAGLGGIPVLSQLYFDLPKSLLGLDDELAAGDATTIPVGVTSSESSVVYDTDLFEFNLDQWLRDPTLTTLGNGVPVIGSPYEFAISGLLPDSPFSLFVDEDVVFSGTLDAMGSFHGDFLWPDDKSPSGAHFLTAQDSTGEFAWNLSCPEVPEASSVLYCLMGLSAVMFRRRTG